MHAAPGDGAAAELRHLSDIGALMPPTKCKILPARYPRTQKSEGRQE